MKYPNDPLYHKQSQKPPDTETNSSHTSSRNGSSPVSESHNENSISVSPVHLDDDSGTQKDLDASAHPDIPTGDRKPKKVIFFEDDGTDNQASTDEQDSSNASFASKNNSDLSNIIPGRKPGDVLRQKCFVWGDVSELVETDSWLTGIMHNTVARPRASGQKASVKLYPTEMKRIPGVGSQPILFEPCLGSSLQESPFSTMTSYDDKSLYFKQELQDDDPSGNQFESSTGLKIDIAQISACGRRCIVLSEEGDVYEWYTSDDKIPPNHENLSFPYLNVDEDSQYRLNKLRKRRPRVLWSLSLERAMNGTMITAISCGEDHALALSDLGCVYSWGISSHGRLGHRQHILDLYKKSKTSRKYCQSVNDFIRREGVCIPSSKHESNENANADKDVFVDEPLLISDFLRVNVVAISAGVSHAAAVANDGAIYTWGRGKDGRLGHGDESDQLVPKQIDGSGIPRTRKRSGSLSNRRRFSLMKKPQSKGRRGTIATASNDIPGIEKGEAFTSSDLAKKAEETNDSDDIDCSFETTGVLRDMSEELEYQHLNSFGKSGYSEESSSQDVRLWEETANNQTLVFRAQEKAKAVARKLYPIPKAEWKDIVIVRVSCGRRFTVCVDRQGFVWAWGANEYYQCGVSDTHDATMAKLQRPKLVSIPPPSFPSGQEIIRWGSLSSVIHPKSTRARGMDQGISGAGNSNLTHSQHKSEEIFVHANSETEASRNENRTKINSGQTKASEAEGSTKYDVHACSSEELLAVDRVAECYVESHPHKCVFRGSAVAISAGHTHTIALTSDGRTVTWGCDTYNQVGHRGRPWWDTESDSSVQGEIKCTPGVVPLQSLLNEDSSVADTVVAVEAGTYHSVVLTLRGRLLAWGRNKSAILGALTDMSTKRIVECGISLPVSRGDPKIIEQPWRNIKTFGAGLDFVVVADTPSGSAEKARSLGIYLPANTRLSQPGWLPCSLIYSVAARALGVKSEEIQGYLRANKKDNLSYLRKACKARFGAGSFSELNGIVGPLNTYAQWAGLLDRELVRGNEIANLLKSGGSVPVNLRQYLWPRWIGNRLGITPFTFSWCFHRAEAFFICHRKRKLANNGGGGRSRQISESSADIHTLLSPSSIEKANQGALVGDIPYLPPFCFEHTLLKVGTDSPRVYNVLNLFQRRAILHSHLLSVIRAFIVYQPTLGYVQELIHPAALFVLHIPDPFIAFMCMCNFVTSSEYLIISGFYGGRKYSELIELLAELINDMDPQLSKILGELGVSWIVTVWLRTLCIRQLTLPLSSQVLDRIFFDGYKVVFKTVLSILKLLKPILQTSSEDLPAIILKGEDTGSKNAGSSPHSIWEEHVYPYLITTIDNLPLGDTSYSKIENFFNDPFVYDEDKFFSNPRSVPKCTTDSGSW